MENEERMECSEKIRKKKKYKKVYKVGGHNRIHAKQKSEKNNRKIKT